MAIYKTYVEPPQRLVTRAEIEAGPIGQIQRNLSAIERTSASLDAPKSRKQIGDELDRRIHAHMSARGIKSYSQAMDAVLNADKAAARAYASIDRDTHRQDSFHPKYLRRIES